MTGSGAFAEMIDKERIGRAVEARLRKVGFGQFRSDVTWRFRLGRGWRCSAGFWRSKRGEAS
jgi:hypothetical protein